MSCGTRKRSIVSFSVATGGVSFGESESLGLGTHLYSCHFEKVGRWSQSRQMYASVVAGTGVQEWVVWEAEVGGEEEVVDSMPIGGGRSIPEAVFAKETQSSSPSTPQPVEMSFGIR